MRPALIDEMFRLEAIYWWHVAKRRLVLALLQRHYNWLKRTPIHVDIGCGTGRLLQEFSEKTVAIGIDSSLKALRYSKQRGLLNLIAVDLAQPLPLKSSICDIVTMLDVLEHLKTDEAVLNEVYRILRPDGFFIVTVPAYPFLWTYWDEILGHKRRYTRKALVQKLNNLGFKVLQSSHFYSFLLPIALLLRLTKTLLGNSFYKHSDFIRLPRFINNFLILLSSIETVVVVRKSIPLGLSLVCICKKITNDNVR